MKQKIRIIACICALSCITFFSKAQTNFFVADSTMWIVAYEDVNVGITGVPDNIFGYYMDGDTLINAVSYKKIQKVTYLNQYPGWNFGFLTVTGIGEFGYVREDSGRVYFISPVQQVMFCDSGVENMLYDYSLQVGDSSYFCLNVNAWTEALTVIGIDTMLGNMVMHLSNGSYYESNTGGYMGPFEGLYVPVSGAYYWLLKYCKGSFNSCYSLQSVEDVQVENVMIYPNPAKETLHIELSASMQKDAYVAIYDATGYLIIGHEWMEDIDVSKLEKGFYILKITSATESHTKRFTVE